MAPVGFPELDVPQAKAGEPTLMITTPLNWVPAQPGWMPDADITVLIWVDDSDLNSAFSGWYAGWWDGIGWVDCASGGYVAGVVTHWADPIGPVPDPVKRMPMSSPELRPGSVAP